MDMMTLRRSLMMNHPAKPSPLPSEYRQVEYLQSNKNGEYIDTGYPGNMGIAVETRFNMISAQGYPVVIGCRIGSKRFAFPVYYNGFDLAIDSDACQGVWELNHIYNAKIITSPNNNSMVITDDNDYNLVINKGGNVNNNINMYMFQNHYGNGIDTHRATLRIYYLKLYDGGLADEYIVRDFIPCVRKLDSEPGMYDLVTNTFFGNMGNGAFTTP